MWAASGKYFDQMTQESYDNNRTGGHDMVYYLYKCVNEGDRAGPGVIEFIEDCSRETGPHCTENRAGNNDLCQLDRVTAKQRSGDVEVEGSR
jgi:hypothetical protein